MANRSRVVAESSSVVIVLTLEVPLALRSSIAASDSLSSARVAPRSVSREAAISVITFSMVSASESTAPVQDMSPTVR
ncbi:hypothetical protein SALBM217S_09562 [Streptomyces griseoloalbus]